jgi:hypothetical protein
MRRRKHGQGLVEMAFTLPVLLLILLGMIEMGWYVFTYTNVEGAARRASEQAAKEPPSPAQVANMADSCVAEVLRQARRTLVLIDIPDSAFSIRYVDPAEGRQLGSPIQVRIRYTGSYLTPISSIFGSPTFLVDFTAQRSILDTMVFQEPARCP